MIYLNNNTEVQEIFIPKQEITAPSNPKPTYENGFEEGKKVGFNEGREYQKDQLLNLYVTENGQYEREDGWGVVTVDMSIPDCSGAYDEGYNQGYEDGQNSVECPEGGSCNLEDKWVTPSMGDRDGNGLIVVNPSEGYDGLARTVIDPQTIYNEGVEAGRAEGGEGGSCNLGILDLTLTDPYTLVKDASEDGYDGYNQVIVRPDNIIAQQREEATNEFKNQMQEITITENGTYSIDDTELVKSIAFDGNSYFDTGIVPTENIKIEVRIKVTDGNDAGMGGIIIGGGIAPVDSSNYYSDENRGIAIGMGGGAIYGVWGATRSYNNPYEYEKTTTVVLQKTDDSWGWEGEKGSFGASTLYIGGYNKNGEEVEEKFTQSIVYIKIWTDRNDDSTLITYVPNTNGNFDANGVELQRLGGGTTIYVEENVNIYPNGFKRVEVNVECICPTAQEQAFEYDITSFTYNVYDWTSAVINRDNMTNDCRERPLDCLLLRNRNGECTVMTKLDNCSGTVCLASGWNSGSIILSLISKTITKFSANAINSYQLKSIDTGFAQLVGNAIMNCNSLTEIKVTILNNDLSNQFATNCFNGLPTEGTITIKKNVDVTLTDDEITSFFRTIVGELWTITIE